MDTVQQDDDDARFREADLEDGGAELESDNGFLFSIVPDHELGEHQQRSSIKAPRIAHLVLRELWLFASSDDRQVVGLA